MKKEVNVEHSVNNMNEVATLKEIFHWTDGYLKNSVEWSDGCSFV